MNPSKSAISPLDRAVFALITRGWDAGRIKNYEESSRRRGTAMSVEASRTLSSIDAKATGLLTHTSMMIAGLGPIAPLVADNEIEDGIVIAEIAIYLLIALGWLRCLSVFHVNEFSQGSDSIHQIIHRELIIRSELYSICIRGAIISTIVVFALLPLLY